MTIAIEHFRCEKLNDAIEGSVGLLTRILSSPNLSDFYVHTLSIKREWFDKLADLLMPQGHPDLQADGPIPIDVKRRWLLHCLRPVKLILGLTVSHSRNG